MSQAHFKLKKIQQASHRAVDAYDNAAVLPREVADRMISRLDLVKPCPQRVLELGTRTGEGSKMLASRFPEAEIMAVDISDRMLRVAQQKCPQMIAVSADPETLPLQNESVDMIFAHLISPTEEWKTLLVEWRRVLKPSGLLMFSTYGPDTLYELRQCVDENDKNNFFMDMHLIGDHLMQTGFSDPVMDVDHFILLYSDLIKLIREWRILGSHFYYQAQGPSFKGKRAFENIVQRYESYCTPHREYPATFEVIYGHAWCAEVKEKSQGGEVRIPAGELRRA